MSFELREINSSKKYHNGSIWSTNTSGPLTILGQLKKYHKNVRGIKEFNFYLVRFSDGTELEESRTSIVGGAVYNPMAKNVYNVACIGIGPNKSKHNRKHVRAYTLWHGIIARCYSELSLKKNPSYIGCRVCERWLNYQNFCEDLSKIEGYNLWVKDKSLQLDKDIKIKGNKVYSIETCCFVTPQENSAKGNRRYPVPK